MGKGARTEARAGHVNDFGRMYKVRLEARSKARSKARD